MKKNEKDILDYLKGWSSSVYSLNTKGAKFYGASFYERGKWDGSFEYSYEDAQKYDYVVDLSTMEFVKK